MPTNRKICSDIVGFLRANNIDERVSYRLILGILRDAAQTFIKQDADNRRLFKQADLWKPIPCFELEEVPLIDCLFDVSFCKNIMKSKEKLPDFYLTSYGSLVRITNIDGSGNYQETSFDSYKDAKNHKYVNKNNFYFWIVDGYLYIPDTTITAVRVSGFFKDNYGILCSEDKLCVKPLDLEFNCPDYLVSIVKKEAGNILLSRFGRQIDEKPNQNSNEKQ